MKRISGIATAPARTGVLWILLMCLSLPMNVSARRETAAFRVTDSDAFLRLRTEFTETGIKTRDTESTIQTPHFYNELGVSTRGFVYHPRLLLFDLAGGVTLDKLDIDRASRAADGRIESGGSSLTNVFWDLDANLHFLQKKPYPLTLFYSRQNPLVSTGLEGNFVQENESYGLNFAMIDVLPVRVYLNARRTTTSGESLDRIVDNTYDRITMKLLRDLKAESQVTFDYELTHQLSRNGNPSREILETDTLAHRALLNSRWRFGGRDQFYFRENATFNWRDDPKVIGVQVAPDIHWSLSDRVKSIYQYSYTWNNRVDDDLESEHQDATVSLRYRPRDYLFANIGVRGDKSNEAQGFRQQSLGGFLSGNYSRDLAFGRLVVIPQLDYTYRSRQASALQITIRDESLALSATTPTALAREFVITDTIVVRNATRTQTFIRDLDYRLIEVGTQAELQRLTTGNILEGESVIVDYEVKAGGSIDYSSLGQSWNVNLNLARYYNIYVHYRGREQKVESGTSTLPLNSVQAVEVGGRADVPLRWQGMIVGGEAKYLYQDEDISPFNETSLMAYTQLQMSQRISLRLTAQRSMRENTDSEDILTAYMGNLTWRARRNLNISATGRHEQGSGRALERSRTDGTFRATWRYRKLSVSAEAQYQQETQGGSERNFLRLWLVIQRNLW